MCDTQQVKKVLTVKENYSLKNCVECMQKMMEFMHTAVPDIRVLRISGMFP